MNRRSFIASSVATTFAGVFPRVLMAQSEGLATLSLDSTSPRIPLPATFTGLSYESAQLSHPGYFSEQNKDLVRLVRQLGKQGVLRIGGNTSDFDDWSSSRGEKDTQWNEPMGPDAGLNIGRHTPVTESAIDNLRTFLDATGWKLLYGINLGHGSPERAADEAAYVVKRIGPALQALQIGNEADLFFKNGIRTPTYSYMDYFAEWQKFADAIRQKVPNAPLAGPDIGNHIDWVDQFAHEAKGINMLTSHYYAEGPPSNPAADIPHLLKAHPTLEEHIKHLVALGKSVNLPYRMSEGNSCYHGGKPGVSDSFASALWGADFMMELAQLGVVGVNFHGGGQGFYTPIAGGGSKPFEARPLYYGMLLFREFAGDSLIPCKLDSAGANATAYASSGSGGRTKLAIINKDLTQDLKLTLQGKELQHPSRKITLKAPSIDSTSGVTLGDREVSESASWSPVYSSLSLADAGKPIVVSRGSAVLLEF
jgi:hypothetical protein